MAEPTVTADPVAQLTSLLSALGGTVEKTNAGDTSQLSQLFAQGQAFDPAALLQSIFQQAGGQIPGLQAAYGNAIGARRGGNSAIQNALNQLLSQTAITGQAQVVQQQQQNMQNMANVASATAQATKGTKKTTGTDMGSAAKNLMLLQGLAKLADTGIGKQLVGGNDSALGKVLGNNSPAQVQAINPDQPQMSMAPLSAGIQQPLDLAGIIAGMQGATQQDYSSASSSPDFSQFLGNDYSFTPDYSLSMPSQPAYDYNPNFDIGNVDYSLTPSAPVFTPDPEFDFGNVDYSLKMPTKWNW